MIESGIPVEVLQRFLGHADIQTTVNTYTDILEKFKKTEFEKYNEYLTVMNLQ